MDVQRGDSPGVFYVFVDADVVLETWQDGSHGRHAEAGAAHLSELLL
jgi:hypothetical protein